MVRLSYYFAALISLTPWSVLSADCQIPLQRTRTSFVASAWIDGRGPFRLLVDSGTSVTVVTPATARRAGLAAGAAIQAISTTGTLAVTETHISELRAGGVSRSDLGALIVDLPHFPSHGRLDGILGSNFFGGSSYLLDVRRRCLTVDLAAAELTGGSRLPASTVAGRVTMHAVLGDGGRANITLDSGASMAVLVSERAASMALRGERTVVTSAAGARELESALVPSLTLGELTLRELPAVVALAPDSGEDALLPVTLFESVYVDAQRELVILNGRVSAR